MGGGSWIATESEPGVELFFACALLYGRKSFVQPESIDLFSRARSYALTSNYFGRKHPINKLDGPEGHINDCLS